MASLATKIAAAATGNFTAGPVWLRQFAGFADRARAIVINNTAGATPTVTVNIQGSVDGITYFNIPYALVGSPSTFVVTAITLTSTAQNVYLLQTGQPYNYIQVVFSANTNETIDVWLYE